MVSDFFFLSGDRIIFFVVFKSKIVIDFEKDSIEDESRNCVFIKELMEVLEKLYDKRELLKFFGDVLKKKLVIWCKELRNGRVKNYEIFELVFFYFEKVFDFDREYKCVNCDDKVRLKLLCGFFFYLKNVVCVDFFKFWLLEN